MTQATQTSADDALAFLRTLTGQADAVFHDGQLEAIQALVDDRRRALVVQRTGWGKSAVYFIATLLMRQRGSGPTLLVSPLLALMRDQVAAAERAGVRAVAINSANAHEWDEARARLEADDVDVLLVSPERLNNPRFREEQLPALVSRLGMLVVDEAHCISDWGHDFRPDYRRLADLIRSLDPSVPVLATTATANARVVADVEEQLTVSPDQPVLTLRGSLARESLRLGVLNLRTSKERLAWLLSHLTELPGSGIIYTLTVAAADDTARLLRDAGHSVRAYTGRTDPSEREESERMLKSNELKALVATSALGMGFDKPDLGFVIHLGAPSSPVAYYQQVGRAGRATDNADVLLLPGPEDRDIWTYFATSSMPSEEKAATVLGALADGVLSTPALEARVDIRRTRLELLLKVLDVDGAVQRVQGGWRTTGQPWIYDAERYERIAEARQAEQQSMIAYQGDESGCRMAMLQRELDDPTASDCGRCDVCTGPWYPVDVAAEATEAASGALDRVGVEVEPRTQWPTGADRLGVDVKGRIAAEERVLAGRCVARLTDLGWGGTLRELFAEGAPDQAVPESLIAGCIRALRDWPWADRPTGVVSIPSRSRPQLIDTLTAEVCRWGQLQHLGALTHKDGIPASQRGGNSAYRLSGVWGAFEVGAELGVALAQHSGPVLLIDDLIDSRWTMTVAGRELRRHGADDVLPFALGIVA